MLVKSGLLSVFVIVCVYFKCSSAQIAATNNKAYTAIVHDYKPNAISVGVNPKSRAEINLDEFRQYLDQTTSTINKDIFVFPEYGLTSLAKNIFDNMTIFTSNMYSFIDDRTDTIIQEISDMAKDYKIYIVANLIEKEVNKSKVFYYNTNVVFNRQGTKIAKYRKINLTPGEEKILKPGHEITTFETDFGVKFGLFTGNDILFYHPSLTVLNNTNVYDIAYPTAWKTRTPFFASLSVQAGYSQANGINLLASSVTIPDQGKGGAGIYSKGNILESYMGDGLARGFTTMMKTVPILTNRETCLYTANYESPQTNGITLQSFTIDHLPVKSFKSVILKLDNPTRNVSEKLCDGQFCCHFNATVNRVSINEEYRLIVRWGRSIKENSERICAMVSCIKGQEVDSCGNFANRQRHSTIFKDIKISTSLDPSIRLYMPATLTGSTLKPLANTTFCKTDKDVELLTPGNNNNFEDVMVFGLYQSPGAVSASPKLFITLSIIMYLSLSAFTHLVM